MASTRTVISTLVLILAIVVGYFAHDYYHQPLWKRRNHKPVVVGMAYGYGWDDLRAFVVSLRDTGYTGEVLFFISEEHEKQDEFLMQRLDHYNVTVIPITKSWPFLGEFIQDDEMLNTIPKNMFPYIGTGKWPGAVLVSLRFYLAAVWFTAFQEEDLYTHVLLTDTRDVIFQLDPFDWDIQDKIYGAGEIPSFPIGECHFNQAYLAAMGDEVISEMMDEVPVCAGTVYGSMHMMQTYLQKMMDIMEAHWPEVVKLDGAVGHDQGFHTYLMYNGDWPKGSVEVMRNGEGQVRTVAAEYGRNYPPPLQGIRVLNDDGKPVRVVHQWDRNGELHSLIKQRYWWRDEF